MSLLAIVKLISAAAGVLVAILTALSRRFGPASWLLSLFLIPASLSCAALAIAPQYETWTTADALRLAFFFLILSAPGGLMTSRTIDRDNYWSSLWHQRFSTTVLLPAAPLLAASLYSRIAVLNLEQALPPNSVALGPPGYISASYLLVVSVIVLANLEQTLRSAEEHIRWEIKFLLIGLAVSFGSVIYLSSKVLLYPVGTGLLLLDSVQLFPIIFLVSCTLTVISWRRSSGRGRLVVSHGFVYSSITLLGVGAYLIASSLLARWASQWGTQGFPIEALVFLLSALVLAAVLLATTFRHRIRLWIRRNILSGRFDYRRFWLEASERVRSTNPLRQSAASVADLVCQAIGAVDVSVWLRARHPNRLQLLAARGTIADTLSAEIFGIVENILDQTGPIAVQNDGQATGTKIDGSFVARTRAVLLVPLCSGGQCVGLLTVGPDRSGRRFDWQVHEFLSILASHAAAEFHKSELLATLVEAKEMEAFSAFSTFLLHDLKNFASTLSLIAQNAVHHQSKPEFQADAFQSIFDIAEKMRRLCNSLRTFSNNLAANKTSVDMNQIVRAVLAHLDVGISQSLSLELAELPPILVDAEEVTRVLQNLLLNARDAVSSGGKITVETAHVDGAVEVSVSDTGCGMTKEFIENELFLPFHTTKSDGLGVGLFQSKRIIEAHEGRIYIESEKGKGTKVRVSLPARSKR